MAAANKPESEEAALTLIAVQRAHRAADSALKTQGEQLQRALSSLLQPASVRRCEEERKHVVQCYEAANAPNNSKTSLDCQEAVSTFQRCAEEAQHAHHELVKSYLQARAAAMAEAGISPPVVPH